MLKTSVLVAVMMTGLVLPAWAQISTLETLESPDVIHIGAAKPVVPAARTRVLHVSAAATSAVAEPVAASQARPAPIDAARMPIEKVLTLANAAFKGSDGDALYGLELLMPHVRKGDRLAIQSLAKSIVARKYPLGDNARAVVRALRSEAMRGSISSVMAWAVIADRGIDVPRDEAEAFKWYRWAAKVGSDAGREATALALANGQGVAPDSAEAVKWAAMLPERRRGQVYLELARLYVAGAPPLRDAALGERLAAEAVKLDIENANKAIKILSSGDNAASTTAVINDIAAQAAAAGNLQPRVQQAKLLSSSSDPVVVTQTIKIYEQLARSGDQKAVSELSRVLTGSVLVPENAASIFQVLEEQANKGNFEAVKAVSNAYIYGIGTDVSFTKAAELYTRSANNGDVDAQFQLYLMYFTPIGFERDVATANTWLKKAAEGGHRLARATLASRGNS